MVTLVGSCLELIRYIHRIRKVDEVKLCRNMLLIGYVAVILIAMRSKYLQCDSGYDEKTVSRLQFNALIYAGCMYLFLWLAPHDGQNTPRLSEFTTINFILIVAHNYVVSAAIDIENWLQVLGWILSFASSMIIFEVLVSQNPEPAPTAPDTTANIRDRLNERERMIREVRRDLARNRARTEVPANQEEEENFRANILAAWYPIGQSLRADNQRCFDLLIHRYKNSAAPFNIRNAVNKMEEKRRHRDQKNELFGFPNTLQDDDFFDDLADVLSSLGVKGYSNPEARVIITPFSQHACTMCYGPWVTVRIVLDPGQILSESEGVLLP
ncbi:hypothetical protein GCK72_011317 [Caenorhabditis remanei]|uniref:Uncharacterized protein n=1 Tax=Caenorhabditis remanei TaxID=31234 RepID=A0A6A5H9H2_CAERE|nr:hypothetical protein GCK72_011317 [Caenorhabditis remanei]KAF1763052.1 hypothetical protein GCK72_011317 [Caenorhabditis remanei]